MEWMWTIIAMALAGGATYLIAKYGLSSKIAELIAKIDIIKPLVENLMKEITDSFRPEDDGSVKLTADEVLRIKAALQKLLDLFGITLP